MHVDSLKDVAMDLHLKPGSILQDIPKLPDHAASRTFFTWSVNDAAVQAKVAGEYLKAAGNIRARLDFAFRQHAPARPMLHEMLCDGRKR